MNSLRLALLSATLLLCPSLLASTTIACGDRQYTFTEASKVAAVELVRSGDVSTWSYASMQILDADGQIRRTTDLYVFQAGEVRKTVNFFIANDAYDGSFSGTLKCYPGSSSNLADTVPLEYIDDESYPKLTMPATFEIPEGSSHEWIPVVFTPRFAFDIPFQATYVGGTATLGSDIGVTQPIEINTVGSSKHRIGPITDDALPEESESFTIEWSGSGFSATTVVTILDNDPAIRFGAIPEAVQEAADRFSITLTWPLNLHLQRVASLSVAGVDYQRSSSVTFQPGESTKVLEFSGLNDKVYRGDRKLDVTLQSYPLTERRTVTVVDDETKPSFSILDASVDEITSTDGWYSVLKFPIRYTGDPLAYSAPVTLRFTNITAQQNVDFYAQLYYGVGPGYGDLRVPVYGDLIPEEDETFEIELIPHDPTRFDLARAKATGTIYDDDRGALPLAFDSVLYELAERDRRVTIRVNRRGDTSGELQAVIRARNTDPNRFPSIKPVPITFTPGSKWKEVDLLIDDGLYSGTYETWLEVVANGVVHDETDISIADDEPVPTITLGDIEATEGPKATANFELVIQPPFAHAFSVDAKVKEGTALLGQDLIAPTSSSRVEAGAGTVAIPISLKDDLFSEGTETFGIELTFVRPDGKQGRLEANGTILDDDDAKKELSPASSRVSVGAVVTLTLDRGENAPAETIQVRSSDPSVTDVPDTIAATAGQRFVPLDVRALKRGSTLISLTSAARTFSATVDVYTAHTLLVVPRELVLVAGKESHVTVRLAPAADMDAVVMLASSDDRIASVAKTAVVPALSELQMRVRAHAPGFCWIQLALPQELGGDIITVPARVVPETSKRRGTRN